MEAGREPDRALYAKEKYLRLTSLDMEGDMVPESVLFSMSKYCREVALKRLSGMLPLKRLCLR